MVAEGLVGHPSPDLGIASNADSLVGLGTITDGAILVRVVAVLIVAQTLRPNLMRIRPVVVSSSLQGASVPAERSEKLTKTAKCPNKLYEGGAEALLNAAWVGTVAVTVA